MALNVCSGCTTRFAVGLPECPQCRSKDYTEDSVMSPKITIHGGPSIAGVTGSWSEEGDPDIWPAQQAEGGEESSPGTSSSTSAETPKSEPEPGSKPDRSPAPKTANRSSKARTARGSSASSTAGGRTDAPSQTD